MISQRFTSCPPKSRARPAENPGEPKTSCGTFFGVRRRIPLFSLVLACLACVGDAGLYRWRPVQAGKPVELRSVVFSSGRVKACIEQRDVDLQLAVDGGEGPDAVDGTAFGRECIHVVLTSPGVIKMEVRTTNHRYGRGYVRFLPIERKDRSASDALLIAAQRQMTQADVLNRNPTKAAVLLAASQYAEAARAAHSASDVRREAECATKRAMIFHRLAEFGAAEGEYGTAVALWRAAGDQTQVFEVRQDWDKLAGRLGNPRTRISETESVSNWTSSADQRHAAQLREHLGTSLYRKKRFSDGIPHFEAKARLSRMIDDWRGLAGALERLAEGWQELGQWNQARAALQDRLRIVNAASDPAGVAATLGGLGTLALSQGRYREAIQSLNEARAMRLEQGDITAAFSAESFLSIAHLRSGDIETAQRMAEDSLARQEDWNVRASNAARSFMRIKEAVSARTDAIWLRAQRLGTAEACRESLAEENWIQGRFVMERFTGPRIRAADMATLRNTLGVLEPGDAVLSFAMGDTSLKAWVMTRDQCRMREIGPLQLIGDLVEAQALQIASRKGHPSSGKRLAALLEPLLRDAGPSRRIIVTGHTNIVSLPFGALADPLAHNGERLAQTRELVYAPSLLFVAKSREEWKGRGTPQSLAALGDAVYEETDPRNRERTRQPAIMASALESRLRDAARSATGSEVLPRLPFTRREVEQILELKGEAVQAFLGFQATAQALNAPAVLKAGIVHIAAHGFINSDFPEYSGLALSRFDESGQPVKAFVTVDDIISRERPHRLVVLSACQSAAGRQPMADFPLGPATAFLRAGTRSVVASLWKVDDQATAEMMRHFYRALTDGRTGPAAALAAAQRKMIESGTWSDPYFWAGFVTTGDWKP